jgi:hypothetical protein
MEHSLSFFFVHHKQSLQSRIKKSIPLATLSRWKNSFLHLLVTNLSGFLTPISVTGRSSNFYLEVTLA